MAAGLVRGEEAPTTTGVTLVTVPDSVWGLQIKTGEAEDPLRHDPVFQRQVVSSILKMKKKFMATLRI